MAPDLLNIDQLADYLGMNKRAIYNARHRRDMAPALKVGRELRWRRVDVEAWLAGRVEAA